MSSDYLFWMVVLSGIQEMHMVEVHGAGLEDGGKLPPLPADESPEQTIETALRQNVNLLAAAEAIMVLQAIRVLEGVKSTADDFDSNAACAHSFLQSVMMARLMRK